MAATVPGKDVIGVIVESVDFSTQETVPEGEVHTGIVGKGFFPGQILVGNPGRIVGRNCSTSGIDHFIPLPIIPVSLSVLAQEHVWIHTVVAQQADAGAELQVVQGGSVLHEGFLGDDPAQGGRREEAPAGLRHAGELVGAVVAAGELGQILFVIVVPDTAHVTRAARGVAGAGHRARRRRSVPQFRKQGERYVLHIGRQVISLEITDFQKGKEIQRMLSEGVCVLKAHLPGHRLLIVGTFSYFVAVGGAVHVHHRIRPAPGAVFVPAADHHVIGRVQILVVGIQIVIGTARLGGQALHPGNLPGQGAGEGSVETAGLLVAGLVQGGQRTVREHLVVGDGTGVIPVMHLRQERIHADDLVCDGEPAHFVSGVTVRAAGKESRRLPAAHYAAQTGVEDQVRSNPGFDVRAHIVTVVIVTVDITFLSEETAGNEVPGLVVAALDGDIVLVRDARAKDLLDIVHVVPAVGGVAVEHGLDIRLGEIRFVFLLGSDGAARELVHLLRQIVVVGELGTVHETREIRVHRHAHGSIVGDVGVALVTLAGGDDDDATGRLEAVHRRGSTILQDRNAFNISRVNVVDVVHGESVHHIRDAVHGTADAERGLVQARFAGLLDGGNAGQLTGKHL